MGQKTHPIGLRVGLHRKWVSSWYGSFQNKKNFDAIPSNQTFLSQGVISSRGGYYLSGRSDFVENIIKRYSIKKFANFRRILPVDFRLFKGFGGHTYGFLIYSKLVSRR